MANSTNTLSHTKRLCKYHIVIVPKYRRKIIYNQTRKDLQEIIKTLCKYKGVEIIKTTRLTGSFFYVVFYYSTVTRPSSETVIIIPSLT